MQKLTNKEEELMQFFWQYGAMFVKDVVLLYDEPKPHFNTVSTMVRTLETKGFLDHEAFGNTYRYRPIISQEEFSKGVLGNVVTRYFENSYKRAVSALIEEEKISVEELEELIRMVQNQYYQCLCGTLSYISVSRLYRWLCSTCFIRRR
ncbi:MAG: BlaI/MecI/CopY family transcriptional regulator [Alistipes sp.]|nr:BlaI/MecI/CopY family transcriptional regulator [Alistipes sp.]